MTAALVRPRSRPRGPAKLQRAARRRERKLPPVARGPGSSRKRSSHAVSFAMLALALRELSVATAYAIWSAIGTAAVAGLGAVFFSERLTWVAIAGIVFIAAGVVLVTVSGSATHG